MSISVSADGQSGRGHAQDAVFVGRLGLVAHAGAKDVDLVTTELVPVQSILADDTLDVTLVPGRTVEIPLPVIAGDAMTIATRSSK